MRSGLDWYRVIAAAVERDDLHRRKIDPNNNTEHQGYSLTRARARVRRRLVTHCRRSHFTMDGHPQPRGGHPQDPFLDRSANSLKIKLCGQARARGQRDLHCAADTEYNRQRRTTNEVEEFIQTLPSARNAPY